MSDYLDHHPRQIVPPESVLSAKPEYLLLYAQQRCLGDKNSASAEYTRALGRVLQVHRSRDGRQVNELEETS
jgi:hypothetical protein